MSKRVRYWSPEDVPYYEPPPDKRVQLTFRVKEPVREGIDGLIRLWKHRAKAQGKDPDDINLNYVCERLLTVATDGAWAESGGMPKNEEEWRELLRRLDKK